MKRSCSLGAALVDEVLKAVPEASRAAVGRVLAKYAGQTIYLPKKDRLAQQRRREHAARTQLAGGASAADAVNVLMLRFPCSRRTAQADVLRVQRVQEPLRIGE
ncbi:hypothetical protein [Aquabacterium sp.]|uniref:hypothetical protein n=1 Tax=Aquabacterium sp. TaxID=1872578 RepID=UPI0037830158